MRRVQCVVAAGVVLAAVGAFFAGRLLRSEARPSLSAPANSPDSDIVVEPAAIDLGSQLWGQVLHADFVLLSLRETPETIRSVASNCGCTVVEDYAGAVLHPGEPLRVSFTVDTQLSPGSKTRMITVALETGEQLRVPVRLEVRPAYAVTPPQIDFGEVRLGNEANEARTVAFRSELGRSIRRVSTDCRWADAAFAERAEGYEVLVRLLDGKLPPGRSTGKLHIETDDDVRESAVVRFTVHGVQDLEPTPAHVFLVGASPRQVHFRNRTGVALRIVAVRSDSDAITAQIVGDTVIEVAHPGTAPLAEATKVYVTDNSGHTARVLVSTF